MDTSPATTAPPAAPDVSRHLLRFGKDSLVYGMGSALTSFLGIVLVPLVTRLFDPATYGVLDLLVTTVFLANVLLTFGFDTATAILFFAEEDAERRRRLLSSALWFSVLASAAVTIALLPASTWLAVAVLHAPEQVTAVRWTLLMFPASHLLGFTLATLRYRFLRARYLLVVLVQVLGTIGITVLALIPLRLGLAGYFGAWLIATVLAGIFAYLAGWSSYRFILDRKMLARLLRLGLPLIPAGLAGWALALISRFFLGAVSLQELGWYALGVKIASVLGLGIAALQLAWGPFALSIAALPEAKPTYVRVLTVYCAAACCVAVLFAAAAPWFVAIISGPQYAPAAGVVGVLALGLVAYGAYYIVAIGVSIAQKTSVLATTTVIAALLNVGLNALLIPRFGIFGAAWASLAAYAVSTVLLARAAQRVWPVPYEWRRVLAAYGASLAAILLLTGMAHDGSFATMLVRLGVVVLLGFAFLLLRVVTLQELRFAGRLLAGVLRRARAFSAANAS